MEESIQYAKKYLEDLLSFFGLNISIYATTSDEEVIELSIPSSHMNGFLIGQNGETMRAIQFIVSSALKNQNHEVYRVSVDVADYKKNRAEKITETVQEWVAEVKKSGKEMSLFPMNAADRRIVHQVAGEHGMITESVGEGRDRHIILKPAPASEAKESAESPADEKVAEPAETEKE